MVEEAYLLLEELLPSLQVVDLLSNRRQGLLGVATGWHFGDEFRQRVVLLSVLADHLRFCEFRFDLGHGVGRFTDLLV